MGRGWSIQADVKRAIRPDYEVSPGHVRNNENASCNASRNGNDCHRGRRLLPPDVCKRQERLRLMSTKSDATLDNFPAHKIQGPQGVGLIMSEGNCKLRRHCSYVAVQNAHAELGRRNVPGTLVGQGSGVGDALASKHGDDLKRGGCRTRPN